MKNIKIIIIIFVLIVLFGGLIYFVLLPQVGIILKLYQDNIKKESQLNTLEAEKEDANGLKKQEKEISALLDKTKIYLPSAKEAGEFMISLEVMAQETNNKLVSTKFSEEKKAANTSPSPSSSESEGTKAKTQATPSPTPAASQAANPSGLKTLTFDIIIKGDYASLINFLKTLETLNRLNSVESVKTESLAGELQTQIKGKIFYK